MRMELREKDNIIEEMNEQIKKLQDQGSILCLYCYCKSYGQFEDLCLGRSYRIC